MANNYVVERCIESPEREKEYKYSLTFNYDSIKNEFYWSFMVYEKKLKNISESFEYCNYFPSGSELVFSELKQEILDEIIHKYDQEFEQFKKHITHLVFDK